MSVRHFYANADMEWDTVPQWIEVEVYILTWALQRLIIYTVTSGKTLPSNPGSSVKAKTSLAVSLFHVSQVRDAPKYVFLCMGAVRLPAALVMTSSEWCGWRARATAVCWNCLIRGGRAITFRANADANGLESVPRFPRRVSGCLAVPIARPSLLCC